MSATRYASRLLPALVLAALVTLGAHHALADFGPAQGAASGGVSLGAGGAQAHDAISTFARTYLDDTTQAATRTTLGLGTGDSPTFAGATLNDLTTFNPGGGAAELTVENGQINQQSGWFLGLRRYIATGSPDNAQYDSFSLRTNTGAAALQMNTLPSAVSFPGIIIPCKVTDADGLRWTARASETIRMGSTVTAAAGYVQSTQLGAWAVFVSDGVGWHAEGFGGTWTADGGSTNLALADAPISGADGLGSTLTIREAFSLAVDTDQTIFAANVPFAARVVDVSILVSTGIASRTITLRTATGGVGTALSDAFDASGTGVKRNVSKTTTDAIAANSTLAIRAAGGAGTVIGEMIVTLVRE